VHVAAESERHLCYVTCHTLLLGMCWLVLYDSLSGARILRGTQLCSQLCRLCCTVVGPYVHTSHVRLWSSCPWLLWVYADSCYLFALGLGLGLHCTAGV
jgi:hypothetical protein